MALWEGRFKKSLDQKTNDFNSSISFDSRMYKQDILGSIAHSKMLGKQGIIAKEEAEKIQEELNQILQELEVGKSTFDYDAEDIHTFIEGELTKRIRSHRKKIAHSTK